jgi:hypothetical protein
LASASNHQPVLMPVAQRGSADDCTKFVVTGNNDTVNVDASNGSAGIAAAVSSVTHFLNACTNLSSRPWLLLLLLPAQMLPNHQVQLLP